jgi:ribosome-associated toxin RatA of RatAB toxin-antitoxin module
MKSVEKTVLLMHSADDMYALVTDVPNYPQFLPWCSDAKILETHEHGVKAQLSLSFKGLSQHFSTHNTHEAGRRVHMKLIDGPFSMLEGEWLFTPLGSPDDKACKVNFRIEYAFSSKTLAALVGPIFDKIAATMVDAFVKRADTVYGS